MTLFVLHFRRGARVAGAAARQIDEEKGKEEEEDDEGKEGRAEGAKSPGGCARA